MKKAKIFFQIFSAFFLFCIAFGTTNLGYGAEAIRVAAASDLSQAMKELSETFTKQHKKKVELIFGSSGKLFEQIKHNAPFDIFFSADKTYPSKLGSEKLTTGSVRTYAFGNLVLWSTIHDVRDTKPESLVDAKFKKIAIANPRHAPYGARAEEVLKNAGILNKIKDRLVFGENISQAAQFVDTGAADVGIIAFSLVSQTPKGTVGSIPTKLYTPLEQAFVVLRAARDVTAATSFGDFVMSKEGRIVLERYGFRLSNKE